MLDYQATVDLFLQSLGNYQLISTYSFSLFSLQISQYGLEILALLAVKLPSAFKASLNSSRTFLLISDSR